jgi:hypothetical protein
MRELPAIPAEKNQLFSGSESVDCGRLSVPFLVINFNFHFVPVKQGLPTVLLRGGDSSGASSSEIGVGCICFFCEIEGTRRWPMEKKYIVRLNDVEREQLHQIVKQFSGSSQRVRRAQILLKADADGPAWTDARIAEAFGCRTNTVENIRQRLVEFGFAQTLEGKQRAEPARPKCLTGDEEARIIATRLGKPPKGYANWSLRLLADKVVELQLAPKVSHETIRQTLKKTG